MSLLALFCVADERPATTSDSNEFSSYVRPFFAKNCYQCHNARLKTGGLNLEAYTKAAPLQDQQEWEKIARRLTAGEMPPKGMPRPNEKDLKAVVTWIENELASAPRSTTAIRVHRLNRVEYNNTIRDLLGVDGKAANDFPPDDSVFGFDNIAQALTVSPSLMEKYLAAAERISKTALFGPDLKMTAELLTAPLPRRMESANPVEITQPAYYTFNQYDKTGLSLPGSLHTSYNFPIGAEYEFRIVGAGNRPPGSDPGQCTFYIDGKLVKTFVVEEVRVDGFVRRTDHWDIRLRVAAGTHELIIAFPRQFHGLPTSMGGPEPSTLPVVESEDDKANRKEHAERAAALEARLARETDVATISKLRDELDKTKNVGGPQPYRGMAVSEVSITGPYDYVKKPSPDSLRRIYTCGHFDGIHGASCQRKILSSIAARAYRRPVSEEEVERLVSISSLARTRGGSFEEGISLALTAILVSPQFLFRIDRAPDTRNASATPIADQYQLAARLSYFLWSSMPDEELTRLAEQGILANSDVLDKQVQRMLADAKSSSLVDNFVGQWLETRRLEDLQPDRDRFPDFDEYLRSSMIKETQLFFDYVMRQDRSILDFIDGKYTFLNERLAAHYGIPGVRGTEFRKVNLDSMERSGVLTQASVLTSTSYPNRTSVVLRGKWILENILNQKVPPPPPNVPSLDGDSVGTTASLRQQMEQHRKNPVCASCHSRMDPLGFGLENFDATGAWRTMDGKFSIDSSGTTPDGKAFEGVGGMKDFLRKNRDAFAQSLTEKMLIYALGRGIERSDRAVVRQIAARLASEDYKFSALILGIVNSRAFKMEAQPGSLPVPMEAKK
jgi:hypothetical protein